MKEQLRAAIEAGRRKEESDLIPRVDDRPPEKPRAWTARDQLAHLSAWREVCATDIDRVRTGRPAQDISDDDDVENAKIYERTHDLPAAAVRAAASASWDHLAAALETCREEDLMKPRRPGQSELLWQSIQSNANFHLAEHLAYFHSERGDDAAAEASARCSYDLATSTLSDERSRGTAVYNLGCFFAKRGRVQEAMPFLRAGMELRPDLREWAKQDTDLDPIRSEPELVALLG